jgi:hypothetical protein
MVETLLLGQFPQPAVVEAAFTQLAAIVLVTAALVVHQELAIVVAQVMPAAILLLKDITAAALHLVIFLPAVVAVQGLWVQMALAAVVEQAA